MITISRGRAALFCVAVLVLMSAACSGDGGDAAPIGDPIADEAAQSPSWLFTQTSAAGTFLTDADGGHTLTLIGVAPTFTAFTDRPVRDAAVLSTERFVRQWSSMFGDSAPNAVIVEHDPSGASDSFVLTLSDPTFVDSTLTFAAEIVDAEGDPGAMPGSTATPYREPPATFDAVSLFIDEAQLADCTAAPAPSVNLAGCDLSNANLVGADLFGANLTDVDLSGADLSGARLVNATLDFADMAAADMVRTNLSGAHLGDADLKGADMVGANLSGATLMGADLAGAVLTGASLLNADLIDADLTDADLGGAAWSNTTCPNGEVQSEPCSP